MILGSQMATLKIFELELLFDVIWLKLLGMYDLLKSKIKICVSDDFTAFFFLSIHNNLPV